MFFTKRFKDLTGQRFGRWTVKALSQGNGPASWVCICDCGVSKTVIGFNLTRGLSSSCGCIRKEVSCVVNLQHGESSGKKISPEFSVYRGMLRRCYNPHMPDYFRYGGRGITVCARWRESVANFITDMGRRPSKLYTIERKDNNKGYSPDNCCWATVKEQANNRRSSRILVFNGKSKTIAEWSRIVGLDEETLRMRLERGWSCEKALTSSLDNRGRNIKKENHYEQLELI